jgi:signal transduction histidine kinase
MDTGITEEQSTHITAIHDAVQRLSSVNHSLVLLTKLENQEFNSKERINISILLENLLLSFQELLEMKSITLTKSIQPGIEIPLSYPLAEILLNNLLSNAIRHNLMDGKIDVSLEKGSLTIKNTGGKLSTNPDDLFKRFKKGNQSSSSTGLGLSIAKQICDLANMKIHYRFEEGMHVLVVLF